MSKIVESLDRLQKNRPSSSKIEEPENPSAKDSLFSKFGILLWLGASISATVFSYHLGVDQGIQTAKTESPKQWLNYFSDFAPAQAPSLKPETAAAVHKVEAIPAKVRYESLIQAAKQELQEPRKPGFTIQVITYVSERLAKEEAARLTQKGHKAFVVPSGKYFQVCIDLFGDKKLAVKKLSELRMNKVYKNSYPGAYVKFLKK